MVGLTSSEGFHISFKKQENVSQLIPFYGTFKTIFKTGI